MSIGAFFHRFKGNFIPARGGPVLSTQGGQTDGQRVMPNFILLATH